jgi:hypothetical protein
MSSTAGSSAAVAGAGAGPPPTRRSSEDPGPFPVATKRAVGEEAAGEGRVLIGAGPGRFDRYDRLSGTPAEACGRSRLASQPAPQGSRDPGRRLRIASGVRPRRVTGGANTALRPRAPSRGGIGDRSACGAKLLRAGRSRQCYRADRLERAGQSEHNGAAASPTPCGRVRRLLGQKLAVTDQFHGAERHGRQRLGCVAQCDDALWSLLARGVDIYDIPPDRKRWRRSPAKRRASVASGRAGPVRHVAGGSGEGLGCGVEDLADTVRRRLVGSGPRRLLPGCPAARGAGTGRRARRVRAAIASRRMLCSGSRASLSLQRTGGPVERTRHQRALSRHERTAPRHSARRPARAAPGDSLPGAAADRLQALCDPLRPGLISSDQSATGGPAASGRPPPVPRFRPASASHARVCSRYERASFEARCGPGDLGLVRA